MAITEFKEMEFLTIDPDTLPEPKASVIRKKQEKIIAKYNQEYVVPTGRVKVPAGSVVPTGKDNVMNNISPGSIILAAWMKMEQKRISVGSVFDKLPPLSTNFPWFVAQNLKAKKDDDYIDNQIFYTLHNPEFHYRCQIPELFGRQIRACFHGWMILSNHPMWFVWNPITSKLIRLPPLRSTLEDDDYGCCLSSPPDDPKVQIVVKEKEVVIHLLPFLKLPCLSLTRTTFLKGSFSMIDLIKGYGTDLFYFKIIYEDDTPEIVELHLYRLDTTEMTWEELKDLKGAVFCIQLASDDSVFYSQVATEFGGYVHILDGTDKIFYSYNVKDRTVSRSPMASLVRSSDMSLLAMLEYRLEGDHPDSKQEKKDKNQEIEVQVVRDNEVQFNSTSDTVNQKKTCRLEGDHPDSKQEKDKNDDIEVKVVTDNEVQLNSTSDESHLLCIPFHMLEKIMEFCVGVEYMKFRATCKSCHLASPTIQWGNKTSLQRWQTHSLLSPWLMLLNRDTITFTDPMFGDKVDYPWCSLTPSQVISCCFSKPPTSPGCMVLGVTSYGPCYIHYVGQEPLWRSLGISIGVGDPYSFLFPTLHDAVCNEGGLDIFRKIGEYYSWQHDIAKPPPSTFGSSSRYLLAKCEQHILLVIMGKIGESVEVFRLIDSGKEWEKIDSLGKHAMYICDATCLCVEAAPKMKNKIYFPRLHPDNGKIVFYNLETCRYHTSSDQDIEESLGDLFRTTQHWNPHAWIEPSWS
ncbi:hypothetical protein Tco_0572468 [Tanacetum coccineum]